MGHERSMGDREQTPGYSRGRQHEGLRAMVRERASVAIRVARDGFAEHGRGAVMVRGHFSHDAGVATFGYSTVAQASEAPSMEFVDMVANYDPATGNRSRVGE